MAERVPVPEILRNDIVAHRRQSVDVHGVLAPNVGDCWHDLRPHPHSDADLVRGDLVRHRAKTGVSALGLQRVLGLKSYETAWVWMHKLRRAMVIPE